MGDVEAKSVQSRKGGGELPTLMENTAPGNSPARAGGRGPANTRGGPPAVNHGDLDMRIAREGTWFYRGSPIARQAWMAACRHSGLAFARSPSSVLQPAQYRAWPSRM